MSNRRWCALCDDYDDVRRFLTWPNEPICDRHTWEPPSAAHPSGRWVK